MQKHGREAEKADYLQIGGSNINIYSKNKRLCLGAGVLTICGVGAGGGGHKHFCHISRVRDFFSGIGGRKKCVHHVKM